MAKHELTVLRSGERVISERVPGVRSVALGFWVGAGSRDEPDSRAGVSHFIEHLLFKGSSRYSAQDIADMLYRPSFDELDSEREVVLEEIAMVEDTPHDLVHDIAAQAVFGTHPLGRPVIGRAEVISSVSRRALSTYHGRAYAPERLVLAAAGNVRHERLVELLKARNGSSANGTLPPRKPIRRLPPPVVRFQRKETEQYHVCLGGPGIPRGDDRRFAASLLDAIVGGSASSRLFQEIREKRGLAYSVYSYASQYSDSGQIGLYVGTREENLRQCLELAVAELGDLAAGNVKPDELHRAKENLEGRLLLSLESTSNRMTRLGKATVTDTPLLTVPQIVRRLQAVTAADVAELARELLGAERLSAAGIGPDEGRFREAVSHVNPALLAEAA